jgi:Tfp pilus assembly protein PilO
MVQKFKDLLTRMKWAHAIIAIGLGTAYFFFTQDNSDLESREESIHAEQATIASLEKKIKEAKEFERQFEEKKKRYADLVKSLQNLKEALPRQFFLPDLLSDLLREAKQLEMEITLIKPDAEEKQGELYNSLGFNIEAKGTFLQFFIFLDRMAHMQRLVHVENFNLSRDRAREAVTLGGEEGAFAATKLTGGRSVYPGISATLRVVTYRYRGSTGPATTAQDAEQAGGKAKK